LYINEPSVVVGKHQNTYAEINLDYANEQALKVARRITGGGTVYHDPGNLNFSYIKYGNEGDLVNFQRFTDPLIQFLATLSIKAVFGGKNDLLVNGKKISGNAEHVHKNRVLHHGTLLFNTNLEKLGKVLRVDPLKYTDKAVRSVRSRVVNLSEILNDPSDIHAFSGMLLEFMIKTDPGNYRSETNPEDESKILELATRKYSTWDWIFGYSPGYSFNNNVELDQENIQINLNVQKGIITTAYVTGDSKDNRWSMISDELNGKMHKPQTIENLLNNMEWYDNLSPANKKNLIRGFF